MPGTHSSVRALCVAGLLAVAGAQQQQGTRVGAVVPPHLAKNAPPPVTALAAQPVQAAPAPQPVDPGFGTARDVTGEAVNPNTPAIDAAKPNIPVAGQGSPVSVTTTTATFVLARNITVTTTLTTPVIVPVVPITFIPTSVVTSVVTSVRTQSVIVSNQPSAVQPNPIPVATTASPRPSVASAPIPVASAPVQPRASVVSAPIPVASAPAQPSASVVSASIPVASAPVQPSASVAIPTASPAQATPSPSVWRPASSSSAPAVVSSAPVPTPAAPISSQAPAGILGVKSNVVAATPSPSGIISPIVPVPSTVAQSHTNAAHITASASQAPSNVQAHPATVSSQSAAPAQSAAPSAVVNNKLNVSSVHQVHATAPHPSVATAANTTRPANSTQPAVAIMSQTPMHSGGPMASGGVKPAPVAPPKEASKEVQNAAAGSSTAIKQVAEEGSSSGLQGWQIAVIVSVAGLLLLTIVLAALLVRRYKKTHPAKVVMYNDKKALVRDDQEPISDVPMTPIPRAVTPIGVPIASAQDSVDITFVLHCNHVSSNEYIVLSGAAPALGNWQVSAAPCMKFMGGSRYMYTATLPTDQVVEYKYAKMRPDGTTVYMDGPSFGVITGRKSHTLEATPWLQSSF